MIQMEPLLLGALMAPIMLWMAHDALASGTFDVGWAAVVFVAAHVAVLALIALAGLWIARRSDRGAAWLARLHRPRLAHVGAMALGVVLSGGLIHFGIHGGLI